MDVGRLGRVRHQRNVSAIVLAFLAHMGKPSLGDLPKRVGVTYRAKLTDGHEANEREKRNV